MSQKEFTMWADTGVAVKAHSLEEAEQKAKRLFIQMLEEEVMEFAYEEDEIEEGEDL